MEAQMERKENLSLPVKCKAEVVVIVVVVST